MTITGVDNSDDGPDKRLLVAARVTGGNGVAEPEPVTLTVEDDEPAPSATLHLAANPIGENGGSTAVTASLATRPARKRCWRSPRRRCSRRTGATFTQTGSTLTIAVGER